jgi:hypothetical protein
MGRPWCARRHDDVVTELRRRAGGIKARPCLPLVGEVWAFAVGPRGNRKPGFDHAARPYYSWTSPPSWPRRRTSRGLTGIGTRASASGGARLRARWGRDLPGLDTVVGIRRLLDIVVTDGVGLENGIARLRVLISTAAAATNLLKVGEFEERLTALESVVGHGAAQSGDDPLGLP